jgi:hypothetical protein
MIVVVVVVVVFVGILLSLISLTTYLITLRHGHRSVFGQRRGGAGGWQRRRLSLFFSSLPEVSSVTINNNELVKRFIH